MSEPKGKTAMKREFWLRMAYKCVRISDKTSCGYEVPFLLEDGCEGPRPAVFPDSEEAWRTPSGRPIVPVPMFAARCPQCGIGELAHTRWKEDFEFTPRVEIEGEPESPYFAYPDNPSLPQSCGHPVMP